MSTSLTNLTARYQRNLIDVARHASASMSTLVHDDTPRDTGDAQTSWTPEVNGFDTSNSGGSFIAKARQLKAGDTYTLTSSLKYIRPLEYGWSRQAPAGMVRINMARWQDVVNHSARQVSGS